MSGVIGIDLGTTFSLIAKLDEHGKPAVIPVDGERIMASCVYAPKHDDGSFIVGGLARNNLVHEPESVVSRFKRDMGKETVYQLRPGLELTPIAASAAVLRKLVQEAAKVAGPIDEVVITVPANFGEKARRATMEAGEAAGLKVTNIINEPTAAVLTYSLQKPLDGNVLIYDLGGGTFDVTIADVDGSEVECLTSQGADIGGIDFDRAIAELIDRKYGEHFGRTLRESLGIQTDEEERESHEWQSLLLEAEEIKKQLSQRAVAPVLYRDGPDGTLRTEVTREEFEQSVASLIAETEMRIETALESIDFDFSDIDSVLLVGGSSRVPAVKKSLERLFGKMPEELVNLDEAVALGAAVYAGLRRDPVRLNPLQRGALAALSVTDVANHVYGTIILDETGIGSNGLRVATIIPKNTPIPASETDVFYTVADGQVSVRCRVTQSAEEESDPEFVNVILEEDLGPLPPGRPSGQPIEVTYSYDLNQTMHIKFEDLHSGMIFERSLSLAEKETSPMLEIPDFRIE